MPFLGLLAIMSLGLALRLGVMVPALAGGGEHTLADPDGYLNLARSLAKAGIRADGFRINGRATAYRPPLYPLLLAPGAGLFGNRVGLWILGLHAFLGLGTIGLTFVAGRRFGLGDARALIAAAIVALDPVLLVQSRAIMTETASACLIAATLAAAGSKTALKNAPREELLYEHPRAAILTGACLGLGALCRPSLLAVAAVAAILALVVNPGSAAKRMKRTLMLIGACGMVILPWAIRNQRALGEPILTTTHGGYTLALGNNAIYYEEVVRRREREVWTGAGQKEWWLSVRTATEGMSEPEADRALRDRALDWALEHRRAFVRSALARVMRFWSLAPSGAVYPRLMRLGSAIWTLPLWVALVFGLGQRRWWRWPGCLVVAVPLVLTFVHIFYWTDVRMRAPVVPGLALIAASACSGGFGVGKLRGL